MPESLSLSLGAMSLPSPLPGSSAPAYCDIVPLFSQSIAFNRTGAHWPNWKGLRPAFHQSHRRAGRRVYRAQKGIEEVYMVFLSNALLLSRFLPQVVCVSVSLPFLCLIVWYHLMAVETFYRKWVLCSPSIHFSISMQEFLLIGREKENQQQSKRKMSLGFSISLPPTFETCHICVFFSHILLNNSFVEEFARTSLSNEKVLLQWDDNT